jgi:hypothetical protein
VAKLFRVDPKTVTRWAKAGKLTAIRTLGGRKVSGGEVSAVTIDWVDASANDGGHEIVSAHLSNPKGSVVLD